MSFTRPRPDGKAGLQIQPKGGSAVSIQSVSQSAGGLSLGPSSSGTQGSRDPSPPPFPQIQRKSSCFNLNSYIQVNRTDVSVGSWSAGRSADTIAVNLRTALVSTTAANLPDDNGASSLLDLKNSPRVLKAAEERNRELAAAAARVARARGLSGREPDSPEEIASESSDEDFWPPSDEEPESPSRCNPAFVADIEEPDVTSSEVTAALQLFLTWNIAKSPVWSLAEAALQQGPGEHFPATSPQQREQQQQEAGKAAGARPSNSSTPPPLRMPSAHSSSTASWAAQLSPGMLVASALSPANSISSYPSCSSIFAGRGVSFPTESSGRGVDPNTGPSGEGAGPAIAVAAAGGGQGPPIMPAAGLEGRTKPPGLNIAAAGDVDGAGDADGVLGLSCSSRSYDNLRSLSFGGGDMTDGLPLSALSPILSFMAPQPAAVPAIPFGMGPLPLRLLPTRKFIDVPCMSEQLHVMRLVVRARQDLRMAIASAASTPSAAASAAVEASRALRRWGSSTAAAAAEAALRQVRAVAASGGGGIPEGADAASEPQDARAADRVRAGVVAGQSSMTSGNVNVPDRTSSDDGRSLNRSSSLLAKVAFAVADSLVGPRAPPSTRLSLRHRVRGVVAAVSLGMAALNLMTAAHTLAGADFHDPAAGCKALVDFALGCPSIDEVTRDLLRIGVAVGLGASGKA